LNQDHNLFTVVSALICTSLFSQFAAAS